MKSNATFSIEPLDVGTLTVRKSSLTHLRGFDQQVPAPIVMWVIRREDDIVVVDTGAHDSAFSAGMSYRSQTPAQRPGAALSAAGIDPERVRTVVVSHLHYDHAGNCAMFPNADLVVQRREFEYAHAPLPPHRRVYTSPALELAKDRWSIVDGDVELRAGLRLMLTPGHTPGLQTVVVDTANGPCALASDTVPMFENWAGDATTGERIPTSSFVDLHAYYATLTRLEGTGARVLPSHDPALFAESWPK